MKTVTGILMFITGENMFWFEDEQNNYTKVTFVNPETSVLLNTKIHLSVDEQAGRYIVPDLPKPYRKVDNYA